MMLEWTKFDDSYWFECADVKIITPLFPRWCNRTGELLWLKPCVRGQTGYTTRSGRGCKDVRWIGQELYFKHKRLKDLNQLKAGLND